MTPHGLEAKIALVRVRALLLALVCATTPAAVTAETAGSGLDDYSVTTWSEKDGLPPASIRALEQGADGDLWLGTETGLVRFDGQRFIPFERVQHGYDRAGNRLWRKNTVDPTNSHDELYTYDSLYRLKEFQGGTLNPGAAAGNRSVVVKLACAK